jgi:hypothetical protein
MVVTLGLVWAGCGDDDGGGGEGRPAGTRVPGCLSDDGIDLFAAEGDQVLGLTWNNIAAADFSGGYRVRYGTASGEYGEEVLVECATIDCEFNLTGLQNETTYYVVVDSLDSAESVTKTSCEVAATPHELAFFEDLRINDGDDGVQAAPTLAAAWNGTPLFLAWEDEGTVLLARSDDLGETWTEPIAVHGGAGAESDPVLTFRRWVVETDPETDEQTVVVEPGLLLTFVAGGEVMVMRGDFPDGHDGDVVLSEPVSLGVGALPRIAAVRDHLEVAFEDGGQVFAASGDLADLAFDAPQQVDTGGGEYYKPSVAIDPVTDDVYVAYHGRRGMGDTDIYLNLSADSGATYLAEEVRVDDDTTGANQLNVSLAVDHRTGQVMATWEDRRGGANIYFSRSFDGGITWEPNIDTAAGLSGDQFHPLAVVDPGRNVYVVFLDTTNGQRPLFSRFNPDGTFDPPLEVSTAAGQAGAAADEPTVAMDEYGTVFVAWTENREGAETDLFFARAE